jgi:slit 2
MNQTIHNSKMFTLLAAFLLISATLSDVNADPFSSHFGSSLSLNGRSGVGGDMLTTKCPRLCSCVGHIVDCSHRGLSTVPRKIPHDTERL